MKNLSRVLSKCCICIAVLILSSAANTHAQEAKWVKLPKLATVSPEIRKAPDIIFRVQNSLAPNDDYLDYLYLQLTPQNSITLHQVSPGEFHIYDLNLNIGVSFALNLKCNGPVDMYLSTLDMMVIQRYILGNMQLSSLQVLASNMNRDNKVSAADIVEVRRIVQGKGAQLPPDYSWFILPEHKGLIWLGQTIDLGTIEVLKLGNVR